MLLNYLGTIIFWLFFFVTMVGNFLISLLLWLLTSAFDKRRVVLHGFACFWSSLYTWFNPFLQLSIDGREKLERGKTYVICSNHRSIMDIIILYRLFFHFKWVSKKEIFQVPILGWNMYLNNYVLLDRKKTSGQIKMLKDSEAHLRQGSSLLIFPEGTRSKDGHSMGKFREGAFLLAKKTECDIIPIALTGTQDVFVKDILYRKIYKMKITILDPVSCHEAENVKDLTRLTQNRIQKALDKEEGILS